MLRAAKKLPGKQSFQLLSCFQKRKLERQATMGRKLVRVTWHAIYGSQLALLVSSSYSSVDPQIPRKFVLQPLGPQPRSTLCCQQFILKSFWHT